jgi:class 3 adenylate cyclase
MRLVELFELFELQAHEGPCLDCYHTGRPVLNHDLAEPEFDRVLKTVMFTDIVKSTERAVSMGDRRWHELLDAHDAAVRR